MNESTKTNLTNQKKFRLTKMKRRLNIILTQKLIKENHGLKN